MGRLLTIFLFAALPAWGQFGWPTNELFCNFEAGDLYDFNARNQANGGHLDVSTNTAHSGIYSMYCRVTNHASGGNASVTLNSLPSTTNKWFRLYFNIEKCGITAGQEAQLCYFANSGAGAIEYVHFYRDPTAGLVLLYDTVSNSTALVSNHWYCLEGHYHAGNTIRYWLDGNLEYNSTSAAAQNCDGFVLGLITTRTDQDLLVRYDDLVVNSNRLGAADPHVFIAAPNAGPRIGMPVLVVSSGLTNGDYLVNSIEGPSSNFVSTVTTPTGHDVIRVSLRMLAPSTNYAFVARLFDNANALKASNSTPVWVPISAASRISAIDEYNNFVVNGKKHFFVTDFGEGPRSIIADNGSPRGFIAWKTNGYITDAFTMGWDDPFNFTTMQTCLRTAATVNAMFIGPGQAGETNLAGMLNYITNCTGSNNLAGWIFGGEPEDSGIGYKPFDLVSYWTNGVMVYALSNWMVNYFMGQSFYDGDALMSRGKTYCWPWMVTDVYGQDYFPFEDPVTRIPHEWANINRRIQAWNMGLIPLLNFVGPTDVLESTNGPSPSSNMIRFSFWMQVVTGAKGIYWYEYQEYPSWQLNVMSNLVTEVVGLQEQILSWTNFATTPNSTNIFCLGTTLGGTNWIFAVNAATNTTVSSTFTVAGLAAGTTVHAMQDRTNMANGTAGSGSFTASIAPLDTPIFYWSQSDAPTRTLNAINAHIGIMTQPSP